MAVYARRVSEQGPYRDAMTEACPTCAAPLVHGELRECPAGCGEWAAASIVAERWGRAVDVEGDPRLRWRAQRQPIACVVCRAAMKVVIHPTWQVHRCAEHGVWFARDDRGRFEQQMSPIIGMHRAERVEEAQMLALVTAAVASDPAAIRSLASRLLELERALRRLRESGVPV